VDSQLKTAIKKGIDFVVFIGAEEISSGQFTLKNLLTREETKASVADIVTTIKNNAQKQ
jgi:histidyl-tRNA synthetase